jgi:hypothetical protein
MLRLEPVLAATGFSSACYRAFCGVTMLDPEVDEAGIVFGAKFLERFQAETGHKRFQAAQVFHPARDRTRGITAGVQVGFVFCNPRRQVHCSSG